MLGKTPWVDRHLRQSWQALSEATPPELMPQQIPEAAFSVEEFGCGYFGCVMPTVGSDQVVKITTDESEAWFAFVALQLSKRDGGWPPGLVAYHRVLRLERHKHKRRPIYLLWRDEAWDVGFLRAQRQSPEYASLISNLAEYDRWAALALHRVHKAKDTAALIRSSERYEESAWLTVAENSRFLGDAAALMLDASPHRGSGPADFALAVRACSFIAEVMENTYRNDTIGQAFTYYLDNGLMMTDVHLGNVGMVRHPDYSDLRPGITDPGLVIPTKVEWLDVTIPDTLSVD